MQMIKDFERKCGHGKALNPLCSRALCHGSDPNVLTRYSIGRIEVNCAVMCM